MKAKLTLFVILLAISNATAQTTEYTNVYKHYTGKINNINSSINSFFTDSALASILFIIYSRNAHGISL